MLKGERVNEADWRFLLSFLRPCRLIELSSILLLLWLQEHFANLKCALPTVVVVRSNCSLRVLLLLFLLPLFLLQHTDLLYLSL